MKTQKQLKELYVECLRDVWNDDERMLRHCLKSCAYIVELKNGCIFKIEKPKIETSFCFGYGYCGTSAEEEFQGASSMVKHARSNQNYFIQRNLEQIEREIESFKKALEKQYIKVVICPKYLSQSIDNKLCNCVVIDTVQHCPVDLDELTFSNIDDIEAIINGLEIVKAQFIKRLNAYLKRYGLTKIKAWSYLVD